MALLQQNIVQRHIPHDRMIFGPRRELWILRLPRTEAASPWPAFLRSITTAAPADQWRESIEDVRIEAGIRLILRGLDRRDVDEGIELQQRLEIGTSFCNQ